MGLGAGLSHVSQQLDQEGVILAGAFEFDRECPLALVAGDAWRRAR